MVTIQRPSLMPPRMGVPMIHSYRHDKGVDLGLKEGSALPSCRSE